MANPIVHFEICVNDMKKGIEFYKNVLGWDITEGEMNNYGIISTGADPGGGIMKTQGEMKPYVTIYAKVDDIPAVLAKAKENGAHIVQEKKMISEEHGYYGMFADLDGTVIGVWSKK